MTRQDLKQYKYTQEWIRDRTEYIEQYKSTIDNISAILSDMPKGSSIVYDKFAEKIAILEDFIDQLLDMVNKENQRQLEILVQLNKVEQPYMLILDKVYIQGKNLVTVASEMKYDYKYICSQHGIALDKFDELNNTTNKVESRL